MNVLKCKMCGANIQPVEGKTYAVCEYCGCTCTLPKILDDQLVALYNRANHFRMQNDFDKALLIYERIISEDDSQAEAHWGAVLCRFGVDYVENPTTGERTITCNRASYSSVLQDLDYLAALDYTDDNFTKSLYKKEAEYIAEIQKEIVAISQNELPYDIFICYKETDAEDKRTVDSTLAQDMYNQLTKEGFKVFFSRITLENILGKAYEPYIFAALNSAKVMLVVGTKPEYFNAAWVKNEWNRYLARVKKDKNLVLIPCYRDMDAYDLPEEMAMLQSQDMNKIGFMQDIIHGISKLISKDKATSVANYTQNGEQAGVSSLLERTEVFLQDGDFNSVINYCDKILDLDVKCGLAYAYRLCANLKCRSIDSITNQDKLLDKFADYEKIMRFASKELQNKFEQINKVLIDREALKTYNWALEEMNEGNFKGASEAFSSISSFSDAKEKAEECYKLYLEKEYAYAVNQKAKGYYFLAIESFESMGDYLDCPKLLQECHALYKKHGDQSEKNRARMNRKQTFKNVAFLFAIFAVIAGIILAFNWSKIEENYIEPRAIYNEAMEYMEDGNYSKAYSTILTLGKYDTMAYNEDIYDILSEYAYNELEIGNYDSAIEKFESIKSYYHHDVDDMVKESKYQKAVYLTETGLQHEAQIILEELSGYSDSLSLLEELDVYFYNLATDCLEEGLYRQAGVNFAAAGDYLDAADKKDEIFALCQLENVETYASYDDDGITLTLKDDGTVNYAVNKNYRIIPKTPFMNLENIVSVASDGIDLYALLADGTAVSSDPFPTTKTQLFYTRVQDIVAIFSNGSSAVYLLYDGTICSIGVSESPYDIVNVKNVAFVDDNILVTTYDGREVELHR